MPLPHVFIIQNELLILCVFIHKLEHHRQPRNLLNRQYKMNSVSLRHLKCTDVGLTYSRSGFTIKTFFVGLTTYTTKSLFDVLKVFLVKNRICNYTISSQINYFCG